eukprot:comp25258_c0_seq1/m.46981 comp25258_c0_seq1/g.46981  ORF comp25258_c0_seq1/g.46981 comp25258_c0_seq1/m.46981 type:complete len:121 (-) comp25258_c0_seq1:387-749(-)
MAMEKQLEVLASELRQYQGEYQKIITQRTQLESQLKENEIVKEELGLLEDDATVYKLIGPVLVKQELPDAQQNVGKRIEFISKEIDRMETAMRDLERKQTEKRDKLMQLQQELMRRNQGK